jgi:hypothetical protein
MTHTIAGVMFPPRQNVGELTCTCGAVMASDTFNAHRAEVGAPKSDGLRATPGWNPPGWMRVGRKRGTEASRTARKRA